MTAPDHAAGKFCALNGEQNDAKIKNILSKDLRAAWENAQAYSDDWAAKNPGLKPPLGDGIHAQAYPDFAPVCKVQSLTGEGDRREVEIFHGFPDNPMAGWTDMLILIPQGGSWVIDDVLFAPDHTTSLRAGLIEIAKDDVAKFVERREACEHFIGEEPYDDERAAFLNKSIAENCTGINRDLEALKVKYADKPNILEKLMVFDPIQGF